MCPLPTDCIGTVSYVNTGTMSVIENYCSSSHFICCEHNWTADPLISYLDFSWLLGIGKGRKGGDDAMMGRGKAGRNLPFLLGWTLTKSQCLDGSSTVIKWLILLYRQELHYNRQTLQAAALFRHSVQYRCYVVWHASVCLVVCYTVVPNISNIFQGEMHIF